MFLEDRKTHLFFDNSIFKKKFKDSLERIRENLLSFSEDFQITPPRILSPLDLYKAYKETDPIEILYSDIYKILPKVPHDSNALKASFFTDLVFSNGKSFYHKDTNILYINEEPHFKILNNLNGNFSYPLEFKASKVCEALLFKEHTTIKKDIQLSLDFPFFEDVYAYTALLKDYNNQEVIELFSSISDKYSLVGEKKVNETTKIETIAPPLNSVNYYFKVFTQNAKNKEPYYTVPYIVKALQGDYVSTQK